MRNMDLNMGYMFFLSIVAAIGGLLFGYDTAVISGTIGQVTEQFQLDAWQQGWYVGCALVGSILGVSISGILSDKWGRKRVMILSAVLFSVSGFWCALSPDFVHLVWARILGGVAIGVVSIVSPLYISEVAAAQYRGRLVSLYQVAVTIGFLSAYIVNYYLLLYSQSDVVLKTSILHVIFVSEVWRGMLGMESLPAILFLLVIFFIPESPRWLIVTHKDEKAESVLSRIYRSTQVIREQISLTKSVLIEENRKSDWPYIMAARYFKSCYYWCLHCNVRTVYGS